MPELSCGHDVDVEVDSTVGDKHHASELVRKSEEGIHLRSLVDVEIMKCNQTNVLGEGQDEKDRRNKNKSNSDLAISFRSACRGSFLGCR